VAVLIKFSAYDHLNCCQVELVDRRGKIIFHQDVAWVEKLLLLTLLLNSGESLPAA